VPYKVKSDASSKSDLTEMTDEQRWALYAPWLEHADRGVRANAIICLIHQANYLLDQQIAALEKAFVTQGGYSEQLAAARLTERKRKRDASEPTESTPACPKCGRLMVLRSVKSGASAGRQFWGCSEYPKCRGAVDV